MKGEPSFLPTGRTTTEWPGGPYGRILHFGVREHAMGGIVNGINIDGLTRAYCGTFFVFADYLRPAVRIAALCGVPSIFVWTHCDQPVAGQEMGEAELMAIDDLG